jgi:hypothetical protein
MILYLNEKRFARELSEVPRALRSRFLDELESECLSNGVKVIGTNGDCEMAVELRPNVAAPACYFALFDRLGVVACDVEPADVERLIGRTVVSAALKRAMVEDSAIASMMLTVMPGELMDRLSDACGLVLNAYDPAADTNPLQTRLDAEVALVEDGFHEIGRSEMRDLDEFDKGHEYQSSHAAPSAGKDWYDSFQADGDVDGF